MFNDLSEAICHFQLTHTSL